MTEYIKLEEGQTLTIDLQHDPGALDVPDGHSRSSVLIFEVMTTTGKKLVVSTFVFKKLWSFRKASAVRVDIRRTGKGLATAYTFKGFDAEGARVEPVEFHGPRVNSSRIIAEIEQNRKDRLHSSIWSRLCHLYTCDDLSRTDALEQLRYEIETALHEALVKHEEIHGKD